MPFVDVAKQSVSQIFATMGEPAEYRAFVSGSLQSPVPGILVMPTTRDDIARDWDQSRVKAETLFDVQVAQLADIPKKSQFTFLGNTWEVTGEPHRDDDFGLVWTFGLRKV